MRKQYHFRTINNKLYAWDVDDLIKLTQNLPIKTIDLNSITELNEPYWYAHEGDVPTCLSIIEHMKLVTEASLAYPIIICPEGKVVDGMHRIAKASLNGLGTIKAYRLPTLPAPNFIDVHPDDLPYDEV
ncbi:hypothetical protein H1R17_01780 [Flavobacterium sp. xlx-214]|uniref:hypothetical protein n=1 Tax=unclassified Flavobacterium TaxID=196869 RepID=UPI0013D5062F|nr:MULTISPECIES: hypothetical protein [unclassified Flavobacterium]MBA5792752.1 hypothetical protein [Flavobacterium sp. xlx-221]QMI83889.1 hypothetical protein H1R17_01780 [Flavobacterium sp. xlx-214]